MGTNLIIHKADGSLVPIQNRRTATRITSGKQNWALNAEDTLNITVESPFPQKYDIGDVITVFGRNYKLNRLPKVKRTGMHEFSYDLEFEGVQYDLLRVTYDLTIDTTKNQLQDVQGDTLTGDLRRFMTVLIANANRVFPGKWVLGSCPETIGDKTLNFGESNNCLAALQTLCNSTNFGVEFEIETTDGIHTINMKERVGQTLPYTFRYGKGGGLYALNRDNVSTSNIVTRLKVYGSTENITMKYRADRLCLPGKTKAQSFIEKPEAVAKYGIFEARKNFDNIKPTYTGVVSSIVAGNVLQFTDNSFPFDISEKEADGETPKYLIAGVDAKIHFNTGNLAGYDFTIKSYDHTTHLFTLNKLTDDRGDVFPSEKSLAFQFGVGDEYKITDIAYSEDIEQAAENKLAEEANKYYDQNSQPKVQYGLTVTKEWLKSLVDATDDKIVNVFAPGDYLHIVDDDIDVDKSVRIKSFTRNILDPYDYSLTISDITTNAQVITRVISDLIDIDNVLTINNLKDPVRARANWRSSREVVDMVFDPEGDYYTDKIKPNSIDTLALSVGAKSMQFGLTNTVFQPNYNGNKNVVKWQGGVLTHYTINEETAMSWVLSDGQTTLSKDSDAYYIYAKCEKNGQAGTIVFSKEQHKVNEDANYYYFWIGILNSVDTELKARSMSLTYGFTMVNGRFIKTGRIESADGTTYFDLDNSEIGGRLTFTSNGVKKEVGTGIENAQNTADAVAERTGNLLPKRYLLDWNKIIPNTCMRGSDADGDYYEIVEDKLFGTIAGYSKHLDIFKGKIKFKPYTQYVLEVRWKNKKTSTDNNNGLWFVFVYDDGTSELVLCCYNSYRTITTSSAISKAGKSLSHISSTYGNNAPEQHSCIYDIQLYEGSTVLPGWLEAPQDRIIPERNILPADKSAEVIVDSFTASKYTVITPVLKIEPNEDYILTVDSIILEQTNLAETDEWLKNPYCYIMLHSPSTGRTYTQTDMPVSNYPQSVHWIIPSDVPSDISLYIYPWKGYSTIVQNRVIFSGVQLAKGTVPPTLDAENRYDNTRTVIEGGIVTGGTLQVAGNKAKVRAGITGKALAANPDAATEAYNDTAVRFWAGEEFKNRETAPARILDNGEAYFSKCYSFFPAFEINAGNMSACIKDNGINLDYTGAKIFLNKGLDNFFISLPKDPKYIGSVVEIYNPYRYQAATCDSILPVNVCTKGDMFGESSSPYPSNGSPVSGQYYALNIRMQKYTSAAWAATSPKWASFSYSVCVIDTKKYAYLKIECIALPPFCVNTASNGNFGTNVLYSFPYAPPVTISGTDSENYHAIWVVSEYILK